MKPVLNFPNYSITKSGEVWSHISKKWLCKNITVNGRLQVSLCKDNRITNKRIHHLVLETYVGSCPEGMECRHLDGNPQNNNLDNLKWGTRSENAIDSIRHGTRNHSKLTEHKVRMIIYMYKTGLFLQKEIAKIYGISSATICEIVNKKTWRFLWA